ncbi:hypothetical protein ACGFIU_19500 [Rhodococcus oryzae]|uniref:hypothetical protein n=1 Tax=Rhodococcus oryzae TaxID=2571143 RepID=UPI0037108BA3
MSILPAETVRPSLRRRTEFHTTRRRVATWESLTPAQAATAIEYLARYSPTALAEAICAAASRENT